jgi:type I restriction enzyme S subunit
MTLTQPRPIKDYCLGIYDGPHATPQESSDGPVFLGIKNITDDGRLDLSDIRHVSEEEFPKWTRRVTPQANDVVFTYEATLHRYALIPEGFRGCLGRRVALVRPDPSQIDSRYLLYFFLSDGWRRVIEGNLISGATVDRIPLEKFPGFPAALPALSVQRKIADILSAYDDLIENNRRRMVLLEEAARQLYREWFVRLRFPGHEHTRTVDSPLGLIAEGWRVVRLGDITTKIGSGATPRGGQSAYQKQGITLIRSLNVYDEHFEDTGLAFINDDQAAQLANVTVEPRDILLNITGASVARCCMVPERHLPARVNQHVMIIRVDTTLADPSFVLCAINSDRRKRQLLSYAQVGATREALTKETITNFEIVLPDEKLLRQFSEVARAINHQREVLAHQNADLRAARDLLLPRLMSGEIAV